MPKVKHVLAIFSNYLPSNWSFFSIPAVPVKCWKYVELAIDKGL